MQTDPRGHAATMSIGASATATGWAERLAQMISLTELQAMRDTLQRAIFSGALRVKFAEQEVEYTNADDSGRRSPTSTPRSQPLRVRRHPLSVWPCTAGIK